VQDHHAKRKQEHLRICLEQDVASRRSPSGFGGYRLQHSALPELCLADVDLTSSFLGHPLRAPILISAITGGTPEAHSINRRLAAAAEELGLAMCLGSQRAAIEDPAQIPTYTVRDTAPDVLLLANLGAVQLNYGYGADECRRVVDMIGADALVLHLNPLQEALQPAGNTDFRSLCKQISLVCRALPVPVIVKEVGWGLSAQVASRLADAGVAALDIAGAGGTSWSEVERHRQDDPLLHRVASDFADWGIPTAEALLMVREAVPHLPIIASGGIRTGPQAALAIAMGASIVGLAAPLLRAATRSAAAVRDELMVLRDGLRIAMFCVGAGDLAALQRSPVCPIAG
jgi:isopentenyl-diphosphate delta-isomerase